MEEKNILELTRDMTQEGINVYIIKNTVLDLLQRHQSNRIQLVVSIGLDAVKQFFTRKGYSVKDIKKDTLYGFIDNTNIQVKTLKYTTFDDFVNTVLPTDFTANTLIMNTDGKIMDLFSAVGDIKEKQLVAAKGFDIQKAEFMPEVYLDAIYKIYRDGYRAEDSFLEDIFIYFNKNSASLSNNQRKSVASVFCQYCSQKDKSNDLIEAFLHITGFYVNVKLNTVFENAIQELISLPKPLFLMILSYIYEIELEKYRDDLIYKAIRSYTGENLSEEDIYDKAFEEYGYEILENVIQAQKIIYMLQNEHYQLPKYHHKSVFAEIKERGIRWQDFNEEVIEQENEKADDTTDVFAEISSHENWQDPDSTGCIGNLPANHSTTTTPTNPKEDVVLTNTSNVPPTRTHNVNNLIYPTHIEEEPATTFQQKIETMSKKNLTTDVVSEISSQQNSENKSSYQNLRDRFKQISKENKAGE